MILLDLPSQGGNLQLAAELSLEDLADLIAAFAEQLGLPPLMPIGLSYGSALAALFAARHPRRCARLLLAGITAFGRPGARLLLEEALARLDEGDQSAFAHGVLTGLINPLQLERTGVSPVFRKAMLRQLQRLTAAEIERYRQNSRRCWPSAASSGTRPARPWCSPASTTISPSPGNMRCSPMPAGTPSSP